MFWFFAYFYYGALVNSSFDGISQMYNDNGNILDSLKTQIFMNNMLEKERANKKLRQEIEKDCENACRPNIPPPHDDVEAMNTICDDVEFQLMAYLIDRFD